MAHVRDVLKAKGSDVATVSKDATVLDAVNLMNERHIGAVIVMDGEQIVGIFTERDLMNRVVAQRKNPETTKISDVMTSHVAICTADDPLETCRSTMTRNKMRHLPVVENGRLVGILSSGDILARELKDQEATIRYLHDYMQGPN